jgi:sulfite exporter TauE/SafE
MNLRWLKTVLRVAAAILLLVAAITLAFGGVSLHTQEAPTLGDVSIDHVIEFGRSTIIMPAVGFLLLGLSFLVPTKVV